MTLELEPGGDRAALEPRFMGSVPLDFMKGVAAWRASLESRPDRRADDIEERIRQQIGVAFLFGLIGGMLPVENGFPRVFGSRKYSGGPGSPQAARPILAGLLATPGHPFWRDELTLIAADIFPRLPAAEDLTEIYLLALAVKRGGRFATFDEGFDASLVPGGDAALLKL